MDYLAQVEPPGTCPPIRPSHDDFGRLIQLKFFSIVGKGTHQEKVSARRRHQIGSQPSRRFLFWGDKSANNCSAMISRAPELEWLVDRNSEIDRERRVSERPA